MIEKEFFFFEMIAKDLEDDRSYRLQLLNMLESTELHITNWNELPLNLFRAFIREIVLFDESSAQIYWCDAKVTPIGSCPPNWPTEPIQKEILKKEHQEISETKMISTKNHTMLYPINQKMNNLHLAKHQGDRKPRVAAYCRVSTDQETQEKSLAIQVAYYVNMIMQNPEWTFAGIYADNGITGTSIDKRPDFKKMISDSHNGQIDLIITKSVSRFARNTVDCLKTVRELKGNSNPVGIWFEQENIYTLSETGELTLSLYSSMAQEEAISFGENMRHSKIKKIESGNFRHGGPPPFGYKINKEGIWSVIPEQKVVVEMIFTKFNEGIPISGIVKRLMDAKIPTPKGGKYWYASYLQRILTNQIYIGHVIYQKKFVKDTLNQKLVINNGELPKYMIENHHAPIINQDLWENVQDRIQKQSRGSINKPYQKDSLPRVIFCSECGSKVSKLRVREKYYYRRCSASSSPIQGKKCNARGYREEDFEHAFMILIQRLRENDQWLENANQKVMEDPLTLEMKKDKEQLEIDLNSCYTILHEKVNTHKEVLRSPDRDLTLWVDKALIIKDKLKEYDEIIENVKDKRLTFQWFKEQLETLPIYDPDNFRIPFREDIFIKVVKSATLTPDNVMIYEFKFGDKVVADGLDKKSWNLQLLK